MCGVNKRKSGASLPRCDATTLRDNFRITTIIASYTPVAPYTREFITSDRKARTLCDECSAKPSIKRRVRLINNDIKNNIIMYTYLYVLISVEYECSEWYLYKNTCGKHNRAR